MIMLIAALAALATVIAVTPPVRRLALAWGALDRPGIRKRHPAPTPSLGGLALMAGVAVGAVVLLLVGPGQLSDGRWIGLLLGTSILLAVGAYDDAKPLSAWTKLLAQVAAAAIAVLFGFQLTAISHPLSGATVSLGWLGTAVSLLWIVAVVNAFNLIDGLDGLCVGVTALAGAALAVVASIQGQPGAMAVLALVAAAALGFLRYNRYPARQFLGDSGSLTLGYLVGSGAIWAAEDPATGVALVTPVVLALAVPLADTVTAVLRRLVDVLQVAQAQGGEWERFELRLDGRPRVFTADRRHVHHRLLDRGYPHAVAVAILWGFAALAGAAAVFGTLRPAALPALLGVAVGLVTYLVLFQLRYHELRLLRKGLLLPLFEQGLVKRRIVHAGVDALLAVAAYAGAYLVAHGTPNGPPLAGLWVTLPVAVAVELGVFYLSGLYRGTYRYAGVGEALRVIRSTVLAATAAAAGLTLAFGGGWEGLVTYVLNGLLLLILVLGSRVSFRVLDYVYGRGRPDGMPTLLYGAGRSGDLALRELLANPGLGWRPVGFIDDQTQQRDRYRAGYPIFGGLAQLEDVAQRHGVRQVVVTTGKLLRVARFAIGWQQVRLEERRPRVAPEMAAPLSVSGATLAKPRSRRAKGVAPFRAGARSAESPGPGTPQDPLLEP